MPYRIIISNFVLQKLLNRIIIISINHNLIWTSSFQLPQKIIIISRLIIYNSQLFTDSLVQWHQTGF